MATVGVVNLTTADCAGDLDTVALAQISDDASAESVIDMLVLKTPVPSSASARTLKDF